MCRILTKTSGIFATILSFCLIFTFFNCPVLAGNTKNIALTGYWPPSNEILRQFRTGSLAGLGALGGLFSIAYAINIYIKESEKC
jgi:hypothetical protein